MTIPRLVTSALLSFLLAAPALAAPPDFSGRWTLVDPGHSPSGAADRLLVSQTSTHITRTVRGGPMDGMSYTLVVERHVGPRVQTNQYDVGGIEGGLVGGIAAGGAPADVPYETFGARWDGESITIETSRGVVRGGSRLPQFDEKESWSLDADGELVLALTTRIDGAPPSTRVLVYEREK
jgi:hypothetical protein